MNEQEAVKKFNDGISELKKVVNDMKSFQSADLGRFEFCKSKISSNGDLTKLPNKGKYIYWFWAEDINGLAESFCEARKGKDGLPVFNEKHKQSHCIYVGSSAELKKRIADHLSEPCDTTYAIKFPKWLNSETKITCYYFKVDAEEILKSLESIMWNQLKPMLGQEAIR